jgi:thiol-disulfide isomerase/thioredoxin
MMRFSRVATFAGLVLGIAIPSVTAQTLKVGDPAPKIEVKSFLKGEPVKEFENGKTYVVEFWATWCGPCKVSIPHLTEMQKKYPAIPFIGVSVWENDQGLVKPFVDEMGDKMDYRVALDALPEGGGRNDGAMAKSWMTAAKRPGIPSAFIVSGESKIYWIGHPMQMDEPLQKIASGSWDLKAAIEEYKRAEELAAKEAAERAKEAPMIRKLQTDFGKAMQSGDPKQIIAAADAAIEFKPMFERNVGMAKLAALIKLDDQDKALEYGKKLFESDMGKEAQGLNGLAWAIVDPAAKLKPNAKLLAFAVEAAKKADELAKEKDPAIADTLAKCYFDSGDANKALETQERAVKLSKGTQFEQDKSLVERLEQYKKAVAAKSA